MSEARQQRYALRVQVATLERKLAIVRRKLDALPPPRRPGRKAGWKPPVPVTHEPTGRRFASVVEAGVAEGVTYRAMLFRLANPASGWRRDGP